MAAGLRLQSSYSAASAAVTPGMGPIREQLSLIHCATAGPLAVMGTGSPLMMVVPSTSMAPAEIRESDASVSTAVAW